MEDKFEALILLDATSSSPAPSSSSEHDDEDLFFDCHSSPDDVVSKENRVDSGNRADSRADKVPLRPPLKASMDATTNGIRPNNSSRKQLPKHAPIASSAPNNNQESMAMGGSRSSLPHSVGGRRGSLSQAARLSMFLDKRIVLYKTEMCRAFQETGVCKYGFSCQFAHYPQELRTVLRHPRYKTDICKTWWATNGRYCPYGQRCCFIHDETPGELEHIRAGTQPQRQDQESVKSPPVSGSSTPDASTEWAHLPAELQSLL